MRYQVLKEQTNPVHIHKSVDSELSQPKSWPYHMDCDHDESKVAQKEPGREFGIACDDFWTL